MPRSSEATSSAPERNPLTDAAVALAVAVITDPAFVAALKALTAPTAPAERLRKLELYKAIGVSPTTGGRLVKEPGFPQPQAGHYDVSEVREYLRRRGSAPIRKTDPDDVSVTTIARRAGLRAVGGE